MDKPRQSVSEIQDLARHLDTTIFDVDSFGSVPDLIQQRISSGKETASFLVTDLTSIVRQFDQWTAQLPEVEPFYAMKCNPDLSIVRLLATLGCGFDCATMGELKNVLHDIGYMSFYNRGLAASKMVYANPAKLLSHLEFAAANGVAMTTFDSEDELSKLAEVNNTLPEGQKLELLLRITTDDKDSICSFSNKFGCPVDCAPQLLDLAKELGLDVIGVSFHVGSGCGDKGAYETAFDHAARLFKYAD